jgi:hypothetical protein
LNTNPIKYTEEEEKRKKEKDKDDPSITRGKSNKDLAAVAKEKLNIYGYTDKEMREMELDLDVI